MGDFVGCGVTDGPIVGFETIDAGRSVGVPCWHATDNTETATTKINVNVGRPINSIVVGVIPRNKGRILALARILFRKIARGTSRILGGSCYIFQRCTRLSIMK